MPFSVFLSLTVAASILTALAGRSELRVSPRPALLTQAFGAYAAFLSLLLVPVGVYFYVFHGDWFLLYFADVRQVPSAVGMLGFILVAMLGAAGFVTAASLVRSQRDKWASAIAFLALCVGAASVFAFRDRLSQVGSYAQFSRGFGLTPYGDGPLVQGTILMGGLVALGILCLLVRVTWGQRRRS